MENQNDILNNKKIGLKGEEIAIQFLIDKKYSILDKNYRFSRFGEIDIIARDKEYLCFIEVKTRSSRTFGYPSEAVTYKKQQNIIRLAKTYIKKNNFNKENIRFDVIDIMISKKNNCVKVESVNLIKNAF